MIKNTRMLFVYIMLLIGSAIILFPFVWMILSSLKTYSEVSSNSIILFPQTPQYSNYPEALEKAPFFKYFLNSVFVAICTTVLVLITSVLSAFALTKLNFKYKNILFSIMIATMMIPGEVLIMTNYATIANLNLIDSYTALIIPYASSVFYIYMVSQFFQGIPNEIYLAAKVDGTSDLKFMSKILIPMSKPILVTVALLNIIGSWNSYLWPSLVTNTDAMRTLPFGLLQFQGESGTNEHLLMAATTMIIIPILILFIFTRKYIIGGLTKGALKG